MGIGDQCHIFSGRTVPLITFIIIIITYRILVRNVCFCYEDMEERREEIAEQFSELQKRMKVQALEHNLIRHELQQARSELEAIIVNGVYSLLLLSADCGLGSSKSCFLVVCQKRQQTRVVFSIFLYLVIRICGCWLLGSVRLLDHHKLRPSVVGPLLNP